MEVMAERPAVMQLVAQAVTMVVVVEEHQKVVVVQKPVVEARRV
jgi:hypothetical protein